MPAEKRGGFAYWRDPVFLLSAGIYLLNREVIKPGLHRYSPFFHGHLNDCLLVPAVLPVYLLFYRWIGLRPDDAPPRSWEIMPHVAVWSIFFKWFGPWVLHHGTPDWLDVGCYAGGGIVSWFIWQWRNKRDGLKTLRMPDHLSLGS